MVTSTLIVLASACLVAKGFLQEPLLNRNTIFGDETLENGPFEFINNNNVITLKSENNPYRLPLTTKPINYRIHWTVNITDLSFIGDVEIDLYATQQNVNEIVIHAHDLNIRNLELRQNNTPIFTTYTLEPLYHFLRVRLTSASLEYNVIYTLAIEFAAPLRTDMTGLYRNWFRNEANEEPSWMASTHFQATAARFAFPCYDEPSFKATFDVTITRPVGFKSWFCTIQIGRTPNDITGYEDDRYSSTPIMSTYLLALIVAEYVTKDLVEDGKLMYEVIARPAAMNDSQGDYAYNFGQELLAKMNSQTDIDFHSLSPNIKMTQAAIPDFSAGAMENWGLLVYREAYLMYSPLHTDGMFKQRIAYILSHEIAHMWFGNLVTCDWWDNLWLNEGFARYYQYYLTDEVDKELGFYTRFVPEQVHTALLTDSANNPHPLNNPGLGSPVEVRTMFTQISYNKGAAVIRMTEHLMGSHNHREGLRKYLRERSSSTALPIHLFQALQDKAVETGAIEQYGPDFNIIDYYKTWSEQAGHPVLNVYVDHQTGEMTITQHRFNINSGFSVASTNWIVPITFATASNPNFDNTKPSYIIKDSTTIINRGSIGDEWVIFNKQQTGFYRVNYDDYTWDLITILLKSNHNVVNELNRAQIVNDVFQFARSGLMNYTRAFNILSYLSAETDYAPWAAAVAGVNWIRNRFAQTSLETQINNMFITWATPVMTQLTYYPDQDESFMRSYLRYLLAPVMCQLNVRECRNAAVTQFQALKNNLVEVPVDSRNWVYCNALREGGSLEDFEFLWDRFQTHPVYSEKIQIVQILGCTFNPTALHIFLDGIVQDNFIIRRQDYTTAFNSAVSGNEDNTQIVFEYIKDNYENVTAALGAATALSYISSRLRTPQQIEEFRQWATNNQALLETNFQTVYNGATTSLAALEWVREVQDDVTNYFTTGGGQESTSTATPTTTTTPVTVTIGSIVNPTTPSLPGSLTGSANASLLSGFLVLFAVVANHLL